MPLQNTDAIFKLWHNEPLLLVQQCILNEGKNETVEEWMGCIRIKVNECNYKKGDRLLRHKFIIWINN